MHKNDDLYTDENFTDYEYINSYEDLNIWDIWCLWWFHHSTINGKSSYDGNKDNVYLSCLNCCPGKLELKYNNYYFKQDKIIYCICFTFMFLK